MSFVMCPMSQPQTQTLPQFPPKSHLKKNCLCCCCSFSDTLTDQKSQVHAVLGRQWRGKTMNTFKDKANYQIKQPRGRFSENLPQTMDQRAKKVGLCCKPTLQ